jgi:hypothetical protein
MRCFLTPEAIHSALPSGPSSAPYASPYCTTYASPYRTTYASPYRTTYASPYRTNAGGAGSGVDGEVGHRHLLDVPEPRQPPRPAPVPEGRDVSG